MKGRDSHKSIPFWIISFNLKLIVQKVGLSSLVQSFPEMGKRN